MVVPALDGAPAERVLAIEGLRAWLAWAVVLSHIVQICGLDRSAHGLWITQFLASEAVRIFIIISGFVITGAVLARHETWVRFLTRRAFRIFPIYLLLLPIGALTAYLAAAAIPFMGWAGDPRFTWDDSVLATIASVEAHPGAHAGLHLTLLQGATPDSLLPKSSQSFLGPAWSLSLEWQFYLIAPLLIWLLRKKLWNVVAIATVTILALLFRLGAFGYFEQPSFLPALGHLFVIGILSRLMLAQLERLRFHAPTVVCAGIIVAVLFQSVFAIALWVAFMALLLATARTHGGLLSRANAVAFASRPATTLGARSYAVYLVHWPVVQAGAYFLLPLGAFSQWQAFALIGAFTVLGTLLAAELLHRFVERPMIRLGSTIAESGFVRRRTAPAGRT